MNITQLILLQTIVKSYLYVPYKNRDAFVCFDINGVRNESWLWNWKKMDKCKKNGKMFKCSIPTNSTIYKVRIRNEDGVMRDSDWLDLYPTPIRNCTNIDCRRLDGSNTILLWYITVCISLVLILLTVRECLKIGIV